MLRRLPTAVWATVSLVTSAIPCAAAAPPGYEYVSPEPGSDRVSPRNNVAIRAGEVIDRHRLAGSALAVVGSISGLHSGRWELADDDRTLIFDPDVPYAADEAVTVSLAGQVRTMSGRVLPPLSFEFRVAHADPARMRAQPLAEWQEIPERPDLAPAATAPAAVQQAFPGQPCDTMPSSYLPATVMISNQPDPGYIFMSPSVLGVGTVGHIMIVDNFGVPVFAQALGGSVLDFKVQPNGLLTYFYANQFFALDSMYSVVDVWTCGNGYGTDPHDFVLLPNGHALLISYDTQVVDMSRIVTGGRSNAQVIGLIVQELDAAKNVVFQWRSWDHFKITDMIEVPGRSLTDATIDWVHGNAVEPTADGNLLISSRHMDEITKINRQTGAIIWRLGLNAKNNEFAFVNDSRGFSHQHDIRELPNGDLTVFDNGNFLTPQYSRGAEYQIDEAHRIATMVWEYRHTPDIYGSATGSNRRRANGAKLICWGLNTPDPKVTDLHADDSIALELGFGATNIFSYRAFRFPWRTTQFVPEVSSLDFGPIVLGASAYRDVRIHNRTGSDITLTCFATSDPAFGVVQDSGLPVRAGADTTIRVTFAPQTLDPVSARLYVRSVQGSTLVAQVIDLAGSGNGTADVGAAPGAALSLASAPNPGRGERTLSFGLPGAARVTLEIFDLSGRRVATPFAGMARAGTTQVRWTPAFRGGPAASGVYFAVLRSPYGIRTSKLVSLDR